MAVLRDETKFNVSALIELGEHRRGAEIESGNVSSFHRRWRSTIVVVGFGRRSRGGVRRAVFDTLAGLVETGERIDHAPRHQLAHDGIVRLLQLRPDVPDHFLHSCEITLPGQSSEAHRREPCVKTGAHRWRNNLLDRAQSHLYIENLGNPTSLTFAA